MKFQLIWHVRFSFKWRNLTWFRFLFTQSKSFANGLIGISSTMLRSFGNLRAQTILQSFLCLLFNQFYFAIFPVFNFWMFFPDWFSLETQFFWRWFGIFVSGFHQRFAIRREKLKRSNTLKIVALKVYGR